MTEHTFERKELVGMAGFIASDAPESFVHGLELAQELVAGAVVRDPTVFRCMASIVDARATTLAELGLSTGLRLAASDEEEDLQAQAAFVGILAALTAKDCPICGSDEPAPIHGVLGHEVAR